MGDCIAYALDRRWLWIAARVLLAIGFIASGVARLDEFQAGLAAVRTVGSWLDWMFTLAIAIALIGTGVSIVMDRCIWLGTAILAVSLLLAVVMGHRFSESPHARFTQLTYCVLEHLSLIGGALAASIASRFRKRLDMALELYCGGLPQH